MLSQVQRFLVLSLSDRCTQECSLCYSHLWLLDCFNPLVLWCHSARILRMLIGAIEVVYLFYVLSIESVPYCSIIIVLAKAKVRTNH